MIRKFCWNFWVTERITNKTIKFASQYVALRIEHVNNCFSLLSDDFNTPPQFDFDVYQKMLSFNHCPMISFPSGNERTQIANDQAILSKCPQSFSPSDKIRVWRFQLPIALAQSGDESLRVWFSNGNLDSLQEPSILGCLQTWYLVAVFCFNFQSTYRVSSSSSDVEFQMHRPHNQTREQHPQTFLPFPCLQDSGPN